MFDVSFVRVCLEALLLSMFTMVGLIGRHRQFRTKRGAAKVGLGSGFISKILAPQVLRRLQQSFSNDHP